MNGKISISLEKDEKFDREPLGELLEQAIAKTCPGIEKDTERARKREALWLMRWAIRSVAELVIREGKIKLPLQVEFATQITESKMWGRSWRSGAGGDYSLN